MKNQTIKIVENSSSREKSAEKANTQILSPLNLESVYRFHKSFPQYKPTPLHALDQFAKTIGVKNVLVKDESYRFGLNAFKVLGGAYAVARYIVETLGLNDDEMTFESLKKSDVKERLGDVTFVTATDGNHGRGVAWAASQLGQKSLIFMPKGSSEIRLQNIRKEGAEASILDVNYDDAVRFATKYAEENNGIFVQDTAWDGYEDIPTWIMQGYTTLVQEAVEQMHERNIIKPTHILLQAGVGSFASSVLGYFADVYGDKRPICAILEPDQAACIYESVKAGDGLPHAVTGDLNTIMAGLACGEPSTISWNILRDYAEMYASCPDEVSALGMRVLGNPIKGDPQVISGESGAVGMGFLKLVMEKECYESIREKLQLDANSIVLIISTEGDTDPAHYRKVVWNEDYR